MDCLVPFEGFSFGKFRYLRNVFGMKNPNLEVHLVGMQRRKESNLGVKACRAML